MIKEANLDVINTLNLALHKSDSFIKGQSPFSKKEEEQALKEEE